MNKKRVHEIDSIVEENNRPNENIKPPKFDVVTEGYNPIIEELSLPDIITATEQHDIDVDRKPSNKTYMEKPIRSNKEDFRSYAKRLDRYIIHLQELLYGKEDKIQELKNTVNKQALEELDRKF